MSDGCQICGKNDPFLLHYDNQILCYYHHNQRNRKDPYLKWTTKGNTYDSRKANK